MLLEDKSHEDKLDQAVRKHGLTVAKSAKFYRILGNHNKGTATQKLIKLFSKSEGKIRTIGIGDSHNDFEMLNVVDKGYLVKLFNNTFASDKFHHIDGMAPQGFNTIVAMIVKRDEEL